MMREPEVGVYLPEGFPSCELYGDNPYHDVVCMMVYVCHTTANFHLKFAEKLRSLEERHGRLEVFLPSCVPDIAHIVYMVHFLERLNPDAEVLFGTDDLPSYDWTVKARFSLFVVARKRPMAISRVAKEAAEEVRTVAFDEVLRELEKAQGALRVEREKVKAMEEKESRRIRDEEIAREAQRARRSEAAKKALARRAAAGEAAPGKGEATPKKKPAAKKVPKKPAAKKPSKKPVAGNAAAGADGGDGGKECG